MKKLYGLFFLIFIHQSIQLHATLRFNQTYHRAMQEQIYKKQDMERQINDHNYIKELLLQLEQEILQETNDSMKKQQIKQLLKRSKDLERTTREPLNNPDHPIFQRKYDQICAMLKNK
jgi:hypothetical protein